VRIKTLSPHVANQIAAGEVIERPASVVKELLENALDAGAKNIDIDIGFGGLNQIKISDDGVGIIAEDLPLAIASHATSKLKALDDLYVIDSMGFRGEALASICSVARVFIQSRAKNAIDAMGLECDEHGIRMHPCARNQGTTIEVRDLFFNAPVRKKFLRTPAFEYQAIERVIKRLAFSRPEIAFTVSHDQKSNLRLPAAPSDRTQRMRLTQLLGKAFVDEAVVVDITRGNMRLHGWVSGPAYARSQQDKLWFYINQRMVRDKLILHALRQAYADVLPEGRYPACVLFLNMPQDAVDINVHPSKYEVRFSDARAVHDLIRLAIMEMLATQASPSHMKLEQDIENPQFTEFATQANVQANHPVYPIDSNQKKILIALNSQFGILTHQNETYLLDVKRLHHALCLDELNQLTQPWDARPLLVPVNIEISVDEQAHLKAHQKLLKKLGLVLNFLGDNTVQVRTIPRALPALDLKQFLHAFCALAEKNIQQVTMLLAASEEINLMMMTDIEQQALIAYWKNLDKTSHHQKLSACLDINSCQKVLDCA
jgi:DNA mismatch repair protein MutL